MPGCVARIEIRGLRAAQFEMNVGDKIPNAAYPSMSPARPIALGRPGLGRLGKGLDGPVKWKGHCHADEPWLEAS